MLMMFPLAAGLFGAAFLAATVLPLSSEAALSAAMLAGLPPLWALAAATAGNALGSMTTYGLGRLGKLEWLQKYCRLTPGQIIQARQRAEKWGIYAAFLCFVPVIGDVLAVALGLMRFPAGRFAAAMTLGKLLRYLVWIAVHSYLIKTTV